MFRLAMALFAAYLLLPENLRTETGAPATVSENHVAEVAAIDALGAAHSVYADISGFCERNLEACETGKAVASIVVQKVRAGVSEFASTPKPEAAPMDQTLTGSIR